MSHEKRKFYGKTFHFRLLVKIVHWHEIILYIFCSLFAVFIFTIVQSKAKQIAKSKSFSMIYHDLWVLCSILHIASSVYFMHKIYLCIIQTNNICLVCLLFKGTISSFPQLISSTNWYSQANIQCSTFIMLLFRK